MNTEEPRLSTMREEHKTSAMYWGEHGEWAIAYARHRDSDALGRSNYNSMLRELRDLDEVKNWRGEEAPIQEEESSHWAVGWVRYIIVNPDCKAAVARAIELCEALEGYPVLDEMDFSNEEQEEADETWKNCFNPQKRVDYIREHRHQFEFRGFADLLGCARGKYFAGYASELLH